MGGAFAIEYTLEHPETVSGLLLAAPGLSGGFEPTFEPDEQAAFGEDEKKSQEVAQAWSKGRRVESARTPAAALVPDPERSEPGTLPEDG
jgi:pimeloyl-ACP methyl ester carboxylesterase